MFDLLYSSYFKTIKSDVLDKLYWKFFVVISNIFLPLYFNLSANNKKHRIRESTYEYDEKYIVSLTTYPPRIDKTWMTIESILHQSVKPDQIILWLYDGEFSGKSSLPKKLLNLEKRGLQIEFCNVNLMSHKKYYYTMLKYSDAKVITIDDDIIYPPDLIQKLDKCHKIFPEDIICTMSRHIKIINNKISKYIDWNYIRINTNPSIQSLSIGCGGVLFPPASLHPDIFDKGCLIKYALQADDLWLKIMSIKNKTKVVSIAGEYSRFFIPILHTSKEKLSDLNISQGNNDKVFDKLIEVYKIPITKLMDNN